MIVDFTLEDKKALQALEESYDKLIAEQERKIEELRPDDPEPDFEAYRRVQESRIPEPKELMPKPIRYDEDDMPIYAGDELEAYYATPEYQAFKADNARANEEVQKLFDEWYNAGSQAWKDARERLEKLNEERSDAFDEFYRRLEDRQFNALGGNLDAILEDARNQIDRLIVDKYRYYVKLSKDGDFSAREVRAQPDGSFLLDTTEERASLRKALSRHIEALKADRKYVEILNLYIEEALQKSKYVGDTGKRGGKIMKQRYDGEIVVRPDKFTTTVDRISRQLFSDRLTRPLDADDGALWEVPLDEKGKGKVIAMAAIDYKELIKSGDISRLPNLTDKHYLVHDAIVSQLLAGNRKMSYEMIYRAMTGKVTGKVEVPEDMIATIDEALRLFGARVQLQFKGKSPNGDEIEIDFDEPLITYSVGTAKLNGKVVKKVVQIPDDTRFDPLLLKWARANGNEIDTRDIKLLDVPKLNNGEESLALKMCLYRRLIKMRNTFERKKGSRFELRENERTIRYDYVYEALGIVDPNVDKRKLVKSKIDRCMSYWKERGLIADYTHKRDKSAGNNFYAVVVSFLPSN